MLCALFLFLHESYAHMVLHRLGFCSACLRGYDRVFNIEFFKNSGLGKRLQRYLCPRSYLLRILKEATSRGSISIFLCGSSAETKFACQMDSKIQKQK